MPRRKFQSIRVRSWTHYVDTVNSDEYRRWAFRGQADRAWPGTSSLWRHLTRVGVKPNWWERQERRSVEEFQEKAHHYLRHVPPSGDMLRWLALMQHHGAPTRLIDFTWSPYVAAFFALEGATGDAAVWAVNGAYLRYDESHDRTPPDPRQPNAFAEHYFPGQGDFVWVGEPLELNERLIAQSGTFAIASNVDDPLEDVLCTYPEPEWVVAQIVIPRRLRDEALQDLRRMNITHATLFPGLDGLARSIAYDLEFHWGFDPKKVRG